MTPLVPADVLDMFHPLRRGADLRGRIVDVHPETADAATIVIRPGKDWAGHVPGQYVRIGIDVDGVREWRAYSLTHGPRADGLISITVKAVPGRQGEQPPRPRGAPRHPGPARAGGRRVRALRAARQAAVRHRRLRHHPGHRDAAQPVPRRRQRRGAAAAAAATSTSSSSTSRPPSRTRSSSTTSATSTPPARSGSWPGTTTCTASSTWPTWRRWCPTWPSARRTPAARPACSTRSRPTTTRPG